MRPAAWRRRPRPRRAGRAGRGGSEAGLSAPARRGAASLLRRRSLLPPPPPSRSLVLAGAAQTCSGAAAPARIGSGCAPGTRQRGRAGVLPTGRGPSTPPGKGLSWSPGSGIRGAAAGGPQSAVSSEQCAPRLRACCRLPSPALCLFLFFPRTSRPLFPILLSLDVSSLCQFAISVPSLSPQPFSLPLDLSFPISTSSLPFSSSTLVSPFLSLSSLFPLSFPSLPLFFPAPLPFPPSCFPLYSFPPRPASLSGPRLPSGFPLPSGGEGLSGVCLLPGRMEAATATCGEPPSRTEGGDGRGRVLTLAPTPKPLLATPSQNEVQAAWSDPCS